MFGKFAMNLLNSKTKGMKIKVPTATKQIIAIINDVKIATDRGILNPNDALHKKLTSGFKRKAKTIDNIIGNNTEGT